MNRITAIMLALAGCSAAGPLSQPPLDIAETHSETLEVAQADAAEVAAAPADAVSEPGPDPSDAPPGFPAVDEFADLATACAVLVPRIVEREDLRQPTLDWCLARAYASSRNGRVRSRLDGSWIHDRDRPAARGFYLAGVRAGVIDPDSCQHHAVDKSIRRTRDAERFAERWPYGTHCDRTRGECKPSTPGHMRESVASRWHDSAPDYERFGTRGPMDNHFATAARYLGGCFPPEQLDRFDVAAAVVIARAVDLCERLESRVSTRAKRTAAGRAGLPTACKTHRDIRAIWSPAFWYERLPAALADRAG